MLSSMTGGVLHLMAISSNAFLAGVAVVASYVRVEEVYTACKQQPRTEKTPADQ